jgi:flagellar basal body-associated protein FliL
MNKLLLVFLIIVIIAAGVFYFVYFIRPQQESAVPVPQVETVNTSFNLKVVDELNGSFSIFGSIPVTVDPTSLRKNNSAKANDPFYN